MQPKSKANQEQFQIRSNKGKIHSKINYYHFFGLAVKNWKGYLNYFCRRKTIMNTFWNSFSMTDSRIQISLVASDVSSNEPQQGKWTERQNATYIAFLQFNKNIFRRKQKRRVHKFYKKMSSFIKTRTPVQCRNHHQKLESKYRYPNRIISSYKENQDLTLYEEEKLKFEMISNQNQKKQPTIQKPIQRESFAIQTDFQSTTLQFVRAEDYLQRHTLGLEINFPVGNWNPIYYYQIPSYFPYGFFKGDECKVQQVMTNCQTQVLPKEKDQRNN